MCRLLVTFLTLVAFETRKMTYDKNNLAKIKLKDPYQACMKKATHYVSHTVSMTGSSYVKQFL